MFNYGIILPSGNSTCFRSVGAEAGWSLNPVDKLPQRAGTQPLASARARGAGKRAGCLDATSTGLGFLLGSLVTLDPVVLSSSRRSRVWGAAAVQTGRPPWTGHWCPGHHPSDKPQCP